MSRVLSYVNDRDFQVSSLLSAWAPPRWFRLWMLWASRLGDGWLWLFTGILLLLGGSSRCLRTLAGVAVAMSIANAVLVLLKRRFHRPRPCAYARHPHFDVRPLSLFKEDCFSFPSGHTLNACAVGSVIALAFPPLAPLALGVAASVAASRVVLGLHFVSDVLAGAILGLAIGGCVYLLVVC
ncbi:MAG TPA: phosphatase PAP2 family protein [Vicinamibacteria bacterium]|nr:phosphatase PAP2 family protein [Vicinamibacteria bacterium]